VQVLTADACDSPQTWAQDLHNSMPFCWMHPVQQHGKAIRRHPDIKLLRKASDVAQTVATSQAQILAALWPTLKVVVPVRCMPLARR